MLYGILQQAIVVYIGTIIVCGLLFVAVTELLASHRGQLKIINARKTNAKQICGVYPKLNDVPYELGRVKYCESVGFIFISVWFYLSMYTNVS